MAEFVYRDNVCVLSFGDKKYELPLNEQTADLLEKTFEKRANLPTFNGGIEEVNAFYDELMDDVDAVLGEGAADDIMSRFKHPGTMELLSVITFIVTEFDEQYTKALGEMKQTAHIPNRETRRARAKR